MDVPKVTHVVSGRVAFGPRRLQVPATALSRVEGKRVAWESGCQGFAWVLACGLGTGLALSKLDFGGVFAQHSERLTSSPFLLGCR